jgi:hypothetical protein
MVFHAVYCRDYITDLPGEKWLPIADTDGKYLVSNLGRVKSLCGYEARILKPYKSGNGYQKVDIAGTRCYVHRLVCSTFRGLPAPGKNTVHHINGNVNDNRLENLMWLSLADNIREAHTRRKKE